MCRHCARFFKCSRADFWIFHRNPWNVAGMSNIAEQFQNICSIFRPYFQDFCSKDSRTSPYNGGKNIIKKIRPKNSSNPGHFGWWVESERLCSSPPSSRSPRRRSVVSPIRASVKKTLHVQVKENRANTHDFFQFRRCSHAKLRNENSELGTPDLLSEVDLDHTTHHLRRWLKNTVCERSQKRSRKVKGPQGGRTA